MPISPARFCRSCLDQSSYEPDLPPFLAAELRLVFAIRAAFSLLSPFLRRASYWSGSFTLGPGLFCGMSLLPSGREVQGTAYPGSRVVARVVPEPDHPPL